MMPTTILGGLSLAALAVSAAAAAIDNPETLSSRASLALSSLRTRGDNDGTATYYGGNTQGGMCSFSTYTLPAGLYGTALSDSNWDTAAHCGQCVAVTGPGGNTITAMITDQCPGCGENHLDLYPDAFAALANPNEGVINVSWSYVDCPITSPLQLHNKEGVSPYWFSMQVVNANEGVASMQVSNDGGSTWLDTQRQQYNFFQIDSGTGTSTVTVKVSSSAGKVLTVSNVPISSGQLVTAQSNFT